MNKVKLQIVIHSHLSDAKIEMTYDKETAKRRIDFVKFLINRHDDLNEEIDADAEYSEFYRKVVKGE